MNNCPECLPSNLTIHSEKTLRAEIKHLKDQVVVDTGIIKAHFGRVEELEAVLNKILGETSDIGVIQIIEDALPSDHDPIDAGQARPFWRCGKCGEEFNGAYCPCSYEVQGEDTVDHD